VVKNTTTKPTPVDTTPVTTGVETPSSGVVKNVRTAPMRDPFDGVIFPLTDSRFVATSRIVGGSTTIESWNTDTFASAGSHPFATADRYVLSPDGDRLAVINQFPSPFVLVWSFRQNQALPPLYLENRPGVSTNPELIGFLTPQRLLTRWQRPGGYAFEVIDVGTREQVYRLEVPMYESTGACLAINHNGALAAIATKDPANAKPTLMIYDLGSGSQIGKTEISGFDPRFPISPTGLAFSFDSHKLAMMFEQGGNGLIKLYQLDPTNGAIQFTTEHYYPAGPLPGRDLHVFSGNALNWTPDGSAWLIYGQGLFSASTGKWLQDMDITGVEQSRMHLPDAAIVVAPAPPVPHQITVLQLDLPKISAMAGR
jgi:hypothetical protein